VTQNFISNPRLGRKAKACGSGASLIRSFITKEGLQMQIKAEGQVQGYVERKSKEGKVFRSVDLYLKGRDPGNLRVNIPEDQMPLIDVCKQLEGKPARASIELRKFEQTGKVFFDLTALELMK
jgi:hypothetical protein